MQTKPRGLYGKTMRLNRGGLILCAAYTALAAVLLVVAFTAVDIKSRIFFAQVTVFPALGLFVFTGLMNPLYSISSWFGSVYFLFPVSVLIIYCIGWGFSRMLTGIVALFDHKEKPVINQIPPQNPT